jgi:hypothetical protein
MAHATLLPGREGEAWRPPYAWVEQPQGWRGAFEAGGGPQHGDRGSRQSMPAGAERDTEAGACRSEAGDANSQSRTETS